MSSRLRQSPAYGKGSTLTHEIKRLESRDHYRKMISSAMVAEWAKSDDPKKRLAVKYRSFGYGWDVIKRGAGITEAEAKLLLFGYVF